MTAPFEPLAQADPSSLRVAIANSPIVIRPGAAAAAVMWPVADWAAIRNSPDVDAFILAWIASHVRGLQRRAAS